jgi:hypothetical protein
MLDAFLAEKTSNITTSLTSFRNNAASRIRTAAAKAFDFPALSTSTTAFADGQYYCINIVLITPSLYAQFFSHCGSFQEKRMGCGSRIYCNYVLFGL